jgi:hypothetical protein
MTEVPDCRRSWKRGGTVAVAVAAVVVAAGAAWTALGSILHDNDYRRLPAQESAASK